MVGTRMCWKFQSFSVRPNVRTLTLVLSMRLEPTTDGLSPMQREMDFVAVDVLGEQERHIHECGKGPLDRDVTVSL